MGDIDAPNADLLTSVYSGWRGIVTQINEAAWSVTFPRCAEDSRHVEAFHYRAATRQRVGGIVRGLLPVACKYESD